MSTLPTSSTCTKKKKKHTSNDSSYYHVVKKIKLSKASNKQKEKKKKEKEKKEKQKKKQPICNEQEQLAVIKMFAKTKLQSEQLDREYHLRMTKMKRLKKQERKKR